MRGPIRPRPGIKIDSCDVCGWDYPLTQLRRVAGKGLVCQTCYDERRTIRRKRNYQP